MAGEHVDAAASEGEDGQEGKDRARRLLQRLAPVIAPGHCLVWAQA
ncbi:hypothetical protein ACFVYE_24970 [Streptomyces sp. NPDC058239]